MNFLKTFNKTVGSMAGVTTVSAPPRYWFGSGSRALNKILSGSFYRAIPQGRIVAITGPSSAGKSFVAANIGKQAQKEGGFVLVIDSENALDDDFMTNIGVDVHHNYQYTAPTTIPQAVKILSSFINGYKEEYGDDLDAPKVVVIVDSLDQLLTQSEYDSYEKGDMLADQGLHSKQLKQMLRTIVNDIKSLNISVVVTKQVYKAKQDQLLAGEGIWVVNDAIRYACSQIVLVTRLKLKDDKTKMITGIRLKAEGFKTRFTAPFQQVTLYVPYSSGIDPNDGVFDIAVNMGVVIKKGSWYNIEGSTTNYRREEIETTLMDQIVQKCEEKIGKFVNIEENDDEEVDVSNIVRKENIRAKQKESLILEE